MKFSQVIILLAATLAIVAFGIASAFGRKETVEEPQEPCARKGNDKACDICCRENGHVAGHIMTYFGAPYTLHECRCERSEVWGVFGHELPEWRKAEQA